MKIISRTPNKGGRRRWSKDQREQILTDYHRSEDSLWKFSKSVRIGYSTLSKWIRNESRPSSKSLELKKDRSPVFQELVNLPSKTQSLNSENQIAVSMHLVEGTEIRIRRGCDPTLLQTILKHLS